MLQREHPFEEVHVLHYDEQAWQELVIRSPKEPTPQSLIQDVSFRKLKEQDKQAVALVQVEQGEEQGMQDVPEP